MLPLENLFTPAMSPSMKPKSPLNRLTLSPSSTVGVKLEATPMTPILPAPVPALHLTRQTKVGAVALMIRQPSQLSNQTLSQPSNLAATPRAAQKQKMKKEDVNYQLNNPIDADASLQFSKLSICLMKNPIPQHGKNRLLSTMRCNIQYGWNPCSMNLCPSNTRRYLK